MGCRCRQGKATGTTTRETVRTAGQRERSSTPAWLQSDGACRRLKILWTEGHRRPDAERIRAMAICGRCPQATLAPMDGVRLAFCGRPFDPEEGRTSGLAIAATTSVSTEKCPQGNW